MTNYQRYNSQSTDYGGYRYFFNGQEADNEVLGEGVSLSAEFWQYDTRLGRRWNVDPKTMVSTSTFSCFCNNPVFYTDVSGDTVRYGSSKERRDVFVARFFSSAFRKEFRVLKKSHLVFTYRRIENGEYGERGGLISVEDAEVKGQ
jgi:hypothetical protein